ncbi:MAG: right-handed parallel beta-helix repeat-containing protein [Planctomycetota bacterium]|jgi:predicted outer membrane repeat protein
MVCAMLLGWLARAAPAGTVHVPEQFPTIQAAIDAADSGWQVLVGPGVYNEVIDLRGKALELRSTDGPFQTTIDGTGFFLSTVTFDGGEGPDTIVAGFTVTGGENFFGGGVSVQGSSPTILDCIITGNGADAGGGLHSFQGSPAIIGCLFVDNVASAGGAIATQGGSLVAVNCTITGNAALMDDEFGGAVAGFGGAPTLFNCICWDNGPIEISATDRAIIAVQHSIVRGGWNGPGFAVLDSDPGFVNAAAADFGLSPFSPAIDAGFNLAVPEQVVLDIAGAARLVDDAGVADTGVGDPPLVDLGAFERQEDSLHVPGVYGTIQAAIDAAAGGETLLVGPGTYSENIDFLGRDLALHAVAGPDETVIDGTGLDVSVVRFAGGEGPGAVLDGFTVTGGAGTLVEVAPGIFQRRGGGVLIEGASPTISGCVVQGNGSAVVLGGGVFIDGGAPALLDCTFRDNVAHRGGGVRARSASPVLIDCNFDGNVAVNASGGGMSVELDAAAVLDGCVFEANTAAMLGGGLYAELTGVVLDGCTFIANEADRGGALAMEGSGAEAVLPTACGFYGNTAALDGGAVFALQTELVLVNGIFSGNSATDGGGLLSIDSSTEVINCTFSANTAAGSGGAITALDGASVTGSILWGNSSGDGVALLGGAGDTFILSCDVEGSGGSGPGWNPAIGVDGGGNIDADPVFVDPDGADGIVGTADDDLRPGPSAVVDAGNDAALPPRIESDFGGGSRRRDGNYDGAVVVDMGAWELDPDDGTVVVVNETQGTLFGGIAAALLEADPGDDLVANPAAFAAEPSIDFAGLAVTVRGTGDVDQPAGGQYVLANGVLLASAPGGSIHLEGGLRVPASVTSDLETATLTTGLAGELDVRAAGTLYVQAPTTALQGTSTVHPLGTLVLSSDPAVNAGVFELLAGATLVIESFANDGQLTAEGATLLGRLLNGTIGAFAGRGELVGDVDNDGAFTCTGDTDVLGDFTNRGTTLVQKGTLSIVGDFVDQGSFLGDAAATAGGGAGPEPGDGLSVIGRYSAVPTASLHMPDPAWRVEVAGDFDAAIDDAARFDLAVAELAVLAGVAEGRLEAMSVDLGATGAGLDRTLPGHFPLGTLRLGPGPVALVDLHDNAGADAGAPEAIYVDRLVLEAGTALHTGPHRIYYRTAELAGEVDEPDHLVPIPDCPADVDGNGAVDVDDLVAVILDWGNGGVDLRTDVTGDGTVNVDDLVAVILAWGPCP